MQVARSQGLPKAILAPGRHMKMAQESGGAIFGFSALSRLSRNSHKLFQVLEFLLAHNTKLITTNYLLTDREVWFRKGYHVKPDTRSIEKGRDDFRGMSGTHRKIVEDYLRIISKPR